MNMNRKQEKNNNKQTKTSKNNPLIPITKSKHLNPPSPPSSQYIQKKTNSQFQKNSPSHSHTNHHSRIPGTHTNHTPSESQSNSTMLTMKTFSFSSKHQWRKKTKTR